METTKNSSAQSSNSGQGNTGNQAAGFNMDNLTGMLGGLNIPESLKKYSGTATKAISKMSTTQKVIGGALLLLGAGYLTRRKGGLNLIGGLMNGKRKR